MKYFTGIDLSLTATGVVVIDELNKVILQKVIKEKLKGIERLQYITQAIEKYASFVPENYIAIEGFAYAMPNQAHQLGELHGCVKLALYEKGIKYTIIPPSVIKKFVTGKGNAKKEMMIKEVYKRWGFEAEDNNTADAYAIAKVMQMKVICIESIPKFQADILDKITISGVL